MPLIILQTLQKYLENAALRTCRSFFLGLNGKYLFKKKQGDLSITLRERILVTAKRKLLEGSKLD